MDKTMGPTIIMIVLTALGAAIGSATPLPTPTERLSRPNVVVMDVESEKTAPRVPAVRTSAGTRNLLDLSQKKQASIGFAQLLEALLAALLGIDSSG